MANWYGAARSNYFRVANLGAFEHAMRELDVEVFRDPDGRVCIWPDPATSDSGGWPSHRYDAANDEDVEVHITDVVAEHLASGEVAVLMECGAEKLRYLTGWAQAVNAAGEKRTVTLDDIYELAERDLGRPVSRAEY